MKKLFMLMFAITMLFASFAAADVGELAAVAVGAEGTWTETAAAGSTAVNAGNVTQVNVSGSYTTEKWVGFYGNVSASLYLGSGAQVFYQFADANVNTVYASTDAAFNFGGLQVATPANVDTAWSFGNAADTDQAVDVFTTNTLTHDGVANLYNATLGIGVGDFATFVASDVAGPAAKNDLAFGAVVQNAGAQGFDGTQWQYEMLVPATGSGTDTYFFFMTI